MITGTRYQMRLEINRQTRLAGTIARLQTELSSEKKILNPSDNPVAAARISDIARTQANQETWKSNLNRAAAISASADSVLRSTQTAVTRAGELLIRANTDSLSDADRAAIAIELDSIVQEVTALRETKDTRGLDLFPTGTPISIPVGPGQEIAAVNGRTAVFDTIATPNSGTTDIVTLLTNAANAVRTSNTTGMTNVIDDINAAVTHVANAHGEQGSRGSRIDSMLDTIEESKLDLKDERSGLEDTDVGETVAKLESARLSLQAAQAVFANVNRSNLFDLLS